jgi:hypothetical protein
MNWKGCRRKRSWPNLRYYSGIYLYGLKKPTKNLSRIASLRADIYTRVYRIRLPRRWVVWIIYPHYGLSKEIKIQPHKNVGQILTLSIYELN